MNEENEPDLRFDQELILEAFDRAAMALVNGITELHRESISHLYAGPVGIEIVIDEEGDDS